MLLGIVGLHGQKRASADMQRHEVPFDPGFIQGFEERGRKMQACGGGRNGTFLAGVNRLVIGLVLRVFRALGRDVRWKRDMTDGGDRLI
ncbi:hypothetical protein DSM25558_0269 [Agrobacterium sp. DSM 25558]|nr:hypothetical protein DSM25558_0269 [Agrobacterium sp. DSM 25558]